MDSLDATVLLSVIAFTIIVVACDALLLAFKKKP
jgi:hypothetical protein